MMYLVLINCLKKSAIINYPGLFSTQPLWYLFINNGCFSVFFEATAREYVSIVELTSGYACLL